MSVFESYDDGECLGAVNAIHLSETTRNLTSFMMFNGTIRMIFECEHPLACDNVGIHLTRY